MNLIVSISIAVVALAFLVLVIFLAITLVSLVKSLRRTEVLIDHSNEIVENLNEKLHLFDPLFDRVAAKTQGRKKVCCARESLEEELIEDEMEEVTEGKGVSALEFLEWGLVGLALLIKLKRKKKGGEDE